MSSTKPHQRQKPKKPYPDFPLFPHPCGYWAKKIRGKHHYFGKWNNPSGALATYLDEKDDLYAGRVPQSKRPGDLTLEALCNQYLHDKRQQVDVGHLSEAHWRDLRSTCTRLLKEFGRDTAVCHLTAGQFSTLRTKLQKKWAPTTITVEAARIQAIFNYAYKTDMVDKPIKAAKAFERASSKSLRLHRQASVKKFYEADEIQRMLAASRAPMTAFIYLGLNCGFGNGDCGQIPTSAFDLERGWVDFARPKTGIERRCPLWPETVEAIREAIAVRGEPRKPEWEELAFLTCRGVPWTRLEVSNCLIGMAFKKLQQLECVNTYRRGVGFYALRHTFATVAEGAKDHTAKEFIMGHVDNSIAATYREHIEDERLQAVVDHVRKWLLAAKSVSFNAA